MEEQPVRVGSVTRARYAERPSSIQRPPDEEIALQGDDKAVVFRAPDRDANEYDVYLPPKSIVDIKPTVQKLAEATEERTEELADVALIERKQMRVRSTCFVCAGTIESRTPSIEIAQHYWTQYNNHGSAKVRMHTDCVDELDDALDVVWDDTDVLLADVI